MNLKSQISDLKSRDAVALRPVEYKKSKRQHFDNDDVQLCAQALCLEEMFARPVERGAVFHAVSKRRREVLFTTKYPHPLPGCFRRLHGLAEYASLP